jgi:SAM-dependent methyltransferase
VTILALSRYVSFHARGDAVFAWHGLTGDVAEMSRDVLALLLAFDPPADEAPAIANPPEGLTKDQVQEFCGVLRSRRFLVHAGAGGRHPDEMSPLLAGIPRIPRATVYEETGDGITIYTRAGEALKLDPVTVQLFSRCNGEKSLGQVLGDAGPQALPALLRLARADVAALKILAKPASQGGVQLNPAAESTMPYPELPDARAYAKGGPAPQPKAEDETTFASLFAEPHKCLGGKSYAQALADELNRRGAFKEVRGRPARALSLGIDLTEALRKHVPDVKVDASIALIKESEAFDAIVANEIALQLGFSDGKNSGALALVRDAAGALAPGGVLFIADFGDPKADATPLSVRFADLQAEATQLNLGARVVPLIEAVSLDANELSLSTTKASFPALRALFAAHGIDLTRRAWLRSEIEKLAEGKLALASVQGLQWAPLSERALGLSPKQFWALVAQKPERVLH